MIKTTHTNQTTLINDIMELYGIERFDLDPTYSKGVFYMDLPEPRMRSDVSPQVEGVMKWNVTSLPLPDAFVKSVMFDPPFLATKGPSLSRDDGSNLIGKRFSVFPDEASLHIFYRDAINELYRIIGDGGFLVFKCQDKVSSGKQYFSHVYVHEMALAAGFYPRDLFILVAPSRIISGKHKIQRHARKFHSYFWVFEKVRPKVNFKELLKED